MIDAASEVSSADLLPGHCPRIAPYIYADAEIAALLAAAGQLRPPLRAARHQMLIGLLAVTGMRPGGRSRSTARTPTCAMACCTSTRASRKSSARSRSITARSVRCASMPACATPASPHPQPPVFFIGARGRRMGCGELNQTFIKLIRQAGLEGRGARARPRPHDLRHYADGWVMCPAMAFPLLRAAELVLRSA